MNTEILTLNIYASSHTVHITKHVYLSQKKNQLDLLNDNIQPINAHTHALFKLIIKRGVGRVNQLVSQAAKGATDEPAASFSPAKSLAISAFKSSSGGSAAR